MNHAEYKNILKNACNNQFSESEVYEFWKWFDENLAKIEDESVKAQKFNDWIKELMSHKPIQYIFGYAYFYKSIFDVNDSTLIPRPETEELCERIIALNKGKMDLKGIDIGTGSGCIPITLLKENPTWMFDALDVSAEALKVTEINATKLGVSNRLTVLKRDFFTIQNSTNDYDIIVSNPPYIDKVEITNMDKRVVDFEPHLALFVNEDVLEFYQGLLDFFDANTNSNSQLWMETHQDHCDAVFALFNGKLNAKKIEDFSQNPRFIFVTK